MKTDIQIESRRDYVDVTASTEVIDPSFWVLLVEKVAYAMRKHAKRKILLEVVAPADEMALENIREVWTYALARGLGGVRISHVVTGRPVDRHASFTKSVAMNRGIMLQSFGARQDALGWLKTC